MTSKLLFGLVLSFSLASLAQISSLRATSSSIGSQSSWQDCSAKIQGGDYFPWSVAKPFPWADIQGVWKLNDGPVPLYLKAKVIRTTTNRKILNLSIVSEGNCIKPIAQGIGYIDFSEKNVVRAIMNDGASKYQMKLASFDVRDLEIDATSCGDNIMVASLQQIGAMQPGKSASLIFSDENTDGTQNVMLKKTSEDLTSICKKLNTH